MKSYKNISLLIPCYNEENTIENVIHDFRQVLPEVKIYVYDNLSTDDTANVAKCAGAIVLTVPVKGKGNVVRRMFADSDSDIVIMVDGDDTYDASACPQLIECLIENNHDLVVGARRSTNSQLTYRKGHAFGNKMFTMTVAFIFGRQFGDMLSGYRVMSRRFVKSFPIFSNGFEIETEMTIHALQISASCCEIETKYDARPDGSESKLNTYTDGIKILITILLLFKEVKPFQFFSLISVLFFIVSFFISFPIIVTFFETGLVQRVPTIILSTGLMLISFVSLISGVILDSLSRARSEAKRMSYLSYLPLSKTKKT